MLIGHFAVGLAAKRVAPKVSVGTLVLAAVVADLLFWLFILLGIEHVRVQPGITATNALDLYDIPISHSLLMDTLWAALLGAAYFFRHRYPRGAWVVFIAVLSHWLLDFVSHRADMPLAPGMHTYFGLGLYNSRRGIFIVEGLLWVFGVIIYAKVTRLKNRAGLFGFWGVVVLLTVLWIGTLSGNPPSNLRAAGISSLIFFLCVVAWAYWMNWARPLKEPERPDSIAQAHAG
jgi:membrane-bound metal-dependent hydrolase YbcI (DUF457 family)